MKREGKPIEELTDREKKQLQKDMLYQQQMKGVMLFLLFWFPLFILGCS